MSAVVDADLLALVARAGEAIAGIYAAADHGVAYKEDGSPLTAADRAAHAILVAGLRDRDPSIPVVSEEDETDAEVGTRFWLVDPLDGTKEFVRRNGEFTVNVALVEDGIPVLGVVAAPVQGVTWWGDAGGARRRDAAGTRTIRAADWRDAEEFVVVASRSHADPALDAFLARLPAHRLVSIGSSLKLCLVAEGKAHLYPRTGPTMAWDTAAAHAVVAAAGGRVEGLDGRPLRYDDPRARNPAFVVTGAPPYPWHAAAEVPST